MGMAIERTATADGYLGCLGASETACMRCVWGVFVSAGLRSTTCRSFRWQGEPRKNLTCVSIRLTTIFENEMTDASRIPRVAESIEQVQGRTRETQSGNAFSGRGTRDGSRWTSHTLR